MLKTGQIWVGIFNTLDGDNIPTAPSVAPVGTLYVDGVANGATVTISNISTGLYKFSVTLPSLTAGQSVEIYVTATVSGSALGRVVASDIGDTVRLSDTLTANPSSGGITSSSFASGAITAASIAADAIGASELSADAVAEIADAVYDEAYADHKTAGTFGKLFDILRKSMHIVEGTVASGATPTTSTFRTNLTAATGAYNHQYLVFLDGALVDQGSPVYTYTQTNGVVLLQEALTAAPSVGDTFVILPYHVHPVDSIGTAVQQAIQSALDSLDSGIQGITYQVSDGGDLYELVQGIDSTVTGAFNDGNYTYSDTIRYNGSGVDGVEVIAYSDAAMTTFLAKTTTNSLGQFTIRSDVAGTAYLIFQHADYTFNVTVPQEVTLA